jgi:hypothetical protein
MVVLFCLGYWRLSSGTDRGRCYRTHAAERIRNFLLSLQIRLSARLPYSDSLDHVL